MRATGVVLIVAGGLAFGAAPALADTGVMVGPGRQLIGADQRTATVYVVNPGSRSVRVQAVEMAYAGTWTEREAGLAFSPESFELAPGEQREVIVALPVATDARCRLVGAGFSVMVERGPGVTARGVGVAQLALQGVGGTEADCLAILPKPPPEPRTFQVPWAPIAAIGGALVLFLAGRLTRRDRRPRAVGFLSR